MRDLIETATTIVEILVPLPAEEGVTRALLETRQRQLIPVIHDQLQKMLAPDPDWEPERVRLLAQAEETFGGRVVQRFGTGSFGNHEALDRVHLVEHIWGQFVLESPAVLLHAPLHQAAASIAEQLADFYQAVGQHDWEEEAKLGLNPKTEGEKQDAV